MARRSPGAVRDVVIKVMRGKGEMTTREVLEAVRRETGEDVPSSSVRSYLRITPDKFEHTGHGRYRLKRS